MAWWKGTASQLRQWVGSITFGWTRLTCWLANRRRTLFKWRLPDYTVIVLDSEISERAPVEPWWYAYIPGRRTPVSLESLQETLQRIAGDPDVKGIVFLLKAPDLSLAQAQSLAALFDRFHMWDAHFNGSSAKQIVVYVEEAGTAGCVVAAAADKAIMPPLATWDVLGFQAAPIFLKDTLARLGVEIQVVKIAPWKTALDSLSRSHMSDEERDQYGWLLDSLYADIVEAIATGRKLPAETVRAQIDRAPLTAQAAQAAGLVDAVLYEDELPAFLGQADEPATLKLYARVRGLLLRRPQRRHPKSVGVLSLEGAIITGRSRQFPLPLPIIGNQTVGSATVQQLVRAARDDESLAAVIVHVDSPGGSALASDLIWRELRLLAQEKPLIVYMGNVAASGGYYIATPGQRIAAQRATLTGSVGVVVAKVVTRDVVAMLDAHQEIIRRGANAGIMRAEEEWTADQWAQMDAAIRHIYREFIQRVAESRQLADDRLDELCNGRVWTGAQAHANGLVDALGDFQVAVDLALAAANLPTDGSVRTVPVSTPRQTLLAAPAETVQATLGLDGHRRWQALIDLVAAGEIGRWFGGERYWLLADRLPRVR